MTNFQLILGATGGLLLGWSLVRLVWQEAGEHPTLSPTRLLVLGDSLTASPGYCGTLQRHLEVDVKCVSLPGKGVKDIRTKGLEVAHSFRPGVAVVLAGVNDLASRRGVEYTKAQLDDLYRELHAMGISVIAVELTPWGSHVEGRSLQGETRELNEWIRRHTVPVRVIGTSSLEGQGKDGLHLTQSGGKQLAELVLEAFS